MVHINQKLANIIHLLAVSEDRAHWRTLVMQLKKNGDSVTPTCITLAFLVYLYSLDILAILSTNYQQSVFILPLEKCNFLLFSGGHMLNSEEVVT